MWVQIKQKSNDNVENDNLSTHVLLSKEREAAQNNRITDLEIKQRESEERERELKMEKEQELWASESLTFSIYIFFSRWDASSYIKTRWVAS